MTTEKQLCEMLKGYCKVGQKESDKLTTSAMTKLGKQCWVKFGDKATFSNKLDLAHAAFKRDVPSLTVTTENIKKLFPCVAKELGASEEDLKKAVTTREVAEGGGSDAVTKRLTDTKKYTGAHKERFDATGKGKGKEGRETTADASGYVGGYKNKDTFDSKKN